MDSLSPIPENLSRMTAGSYHGNPMKSSAVFLFPVSQNTRTDITLCSNENGTVTHVGFTPD
jgi:hypothetical protein